MVSSKPKEGESLADLFPDVASQWHPTLNGDLTPLDVSKGSSRRVWWKCPKADDHQWQTTIARRTSGSNCPMCSGRVADSKNNLAVVNPQIAKEWHPTLNRDITPSEVTGSSNRKFWWICSVADDHVWETSVNNRASGKGCPCCAGVQVSITNSLASLKPEMASMWHTTKNGDLTPDKVTASSGVKYWWKCDVAEDHEWHARIKGGCPACAGQQVSVTNSLASLYPKIASEWHPTKNGELSPSDVIAGSNKKVWWKCDVADDHEWQANPNSRTSHNAGCACCAGKKVSVTNSLASLDPTIASQWHPVKNGDLTPSDVTVGTHKKAWFVCPVIEEHEWESNISNRTATYARGCPFCTLTPRSAQEIQLAYELSALIDFDLQFHKVRIKGKVRDVDIVLEPLSLVVEFDGAYWHKNKADKDLEKAQKLEAEGWNVIRVRERPLDSIHKNDVMVEPFAPVKEVADLVLQKIVEIIDVKIPKLKEYLASDEAWREKEALVAIREYQAENARKKAERDAKRKSKSG